MRVVVISWSVMAALFALGCGGASANESTNTSSGSSQNSQNARGGSQNIDELRAGFMDGCRDECFRGGVLTDCPGYCDCMYQRMEADGFEARANQLMSHPESVTTDPFFMRSIAACGPQAIEAGFVNGCSSSDPNLRPMCVCMLGRLCEGRTDEGCAMWILENPNYGDAPAETAELQRIAGLCAGAGR